MKLTTTWLALTAIGILPLATLHAEVDVPVTPDKDESGAQLPPRGTDDVATGNKPGTGNLITPDRDDGGAKVADSEKLTLTRYVIAAENLNTLEKAIMAAGLNETLNDEGSFTLFAPTDAAFDKLPVGKLEMLMLPENKEQLRELLLSHVTGGATMSAELDAGEVKTRSGKSVNVSKDDGKIRVEDATVVSPDIKVSNGVIHIVDTVIMPEGTHAAEGSEVPGEAAEE